MLPDQWVIYMTFYQHNTPCRVVDKSWVVVIVFHLSFNGKLTALNIKFQIISGSQLDLKLGLWDSKLCPTLGFICGNMYYASRESCWAVLTWLSTAAVLKADLKHSGTSVLIRCVVPAEPRLTWVVIFIIIWPDLSTPQLWFPEPRTRHWI